MIVAQVGQRNQLLTGTASPDSNKSIDLVEWMEKQSQDRYTRT